MCAFSLYIILLSIVHINFTVERQHKTTFPYAAAAAAFVHFNNFFFFICSNIAGVCCSCRIVVIISRSRASRRWRRKTFSYFQFLRCCCHCDSHVSLGECSSADELEFSMRKKKCWELRIQLNSARESQKKSQEELKRNHNDSVVATMMPMDWWGCASSTSIDCNLMMKEKTLKWEHIFSLVECCEVENREINSNEINYLIKICRTKHRVTRFALIIYHWMRKNFFPSFPLSLAPED